MIKFPVLMDTLDVQIYKKNCLKIPIYRKQNAAGLQRLIGQCW